MTVFETAKEEEISNRKEAFINFLNQSKGEETMPHTEEVNSINNPVTLDSSALSIEIGGTIEVTTTGTVWADYEIGFAEGSILKNTIDSVDTEDQRKLITEMIQEIAEEVVKTAFRKGNFSSTICGPLGLLLEHKAEDPKADLEISFNESLAENFYNGGNYTFSGGVDLDVEHCGLSEE